MSRISELDKRYAASASLVKHGAQIISVRDEPGARLDSATRELVKLEQRDGPGVWGHLLGATRALRWRLLTEPVPIGYNARLETAVREVAQQAHLMVHAVGDEWIARETSEAAIALLKKDPAVGNTLLDALQEVGPDSAIVVAATAHARAVLANWLAAPVLTPRDLQRAEIHQDIAYLLGPPRFFEPAVVMAPRTSDVTFLVPTWFSDLGIPTSAISKYAEGGMRVGARIFRVGDQTSFQSQQDQAETLEVNEDDLVPAAVWGSVTSHNRAPNPDEVEARKVLLSGNRAIWLDDDGERIRSLDLTQPSGERVGYCDLSAVAAGTYLLLREGESERDSLLERAVARLGVRAVGIQRSQEEWKSALKEKLRLGRVGESEDALRDLGVRAATQVFAWTSPHVMRPQNDSDFRSLLEWVGLSTQPFFENATTLRREVHRAARELRLWLEATADSVELSELERLSHISWDIAEPGFRGMFVSKVLAVSPHTQLIPRWDARRPFQDEGAKWLE